MCLCVRSNKHNSSPEIPLSIVLQLHKLENPVVHKHLTPSACLWNRIWGKALKKHLQIWHKRPLGMKDELIRLKGRAHCGLFFSPVFFIDMTFSYPPSWLPPSEDTRTGFLLFLWSMNFTHTANVCVLWHFYHIQIQNKITDSFNSLEYR